MIWNGLLKRLSPWYRRDNEEVLIRLVQRGLCPQDALNQVLTFVEQVGSDTSASHRDFVSIVRALLAQTTTSVVDAEGLRRAYLFYRNNESMVWQILSHSKATPELRDLAAKDAKNARIRWLIADQWGGRRAGLASVFKIDFARTTS